jgi:EAL domain-containing protein (putative c-di-GMP-specific phosphodiesterase class I)
MPDPHRRTQLLDFFEPPAQDRTGTAPDSVTRMLKAIRAHLGMDVAFVSEISGGAVHIRHADTEAGGPIHVGDIFPAGDSYCQRIVDGRLPQIMSDTSVIPEAAALAATAGLPVGAVLSVPIRLGDGRTYGTFCCFGFAANGSLNHRDLAMIRAFAELAASEIDARLSTERTREETAARIRAVIDQDGIRAVYQPVYRLSDGAITGVESLARFPDCETRPPSDWFAEAAEIGLGTELEVAAAKAALEGLRYLPDDISLGINLSPATLLSKELGPLIAAVPAGRIVVEVTEHAAVNDYAGLVRALAPLRQRVRLAIDDVGAGYSGMRHILDLRPDLIKLDMSLVRDIDKDPARRSLAVALVGFASGIDSQIVAEGVETAAELAVLREIGVPKAQGYHLCRPMPLMAVRQFLLGARAEPERASEGPLRLIQPANPRRPIAI